MPNKKKNLGQHFTPKIITDRYLSVFRAIYKKDLTIVDPFVGEGNLLIAFLDTLSIEEASNYINRLKIKGYDYDNKVILRLKKIFKDRYNTDSRILDLIFKKNNSLLDNIIRPDDFIITNPPYLARNTAKTKFPKDYKRNFSKNNFHDYYEMSLFKYIKNDGIWILPSNIYSNMKLEELRVTLFKNSYIDLLCVYESPVFKNTRISVTSFVKYKKDKEQNNIDFTFINKKGHKSMSIDIDNGVLCNEWSKMIHKKKSPIEKVDQGIQRKHLSSGNNKVCIINEEYEIEYLQIDNKTLNLLKRNHLILRTVDTGSPDGNMGLYLLKDLFDHLFVDHQPIALLTKKTSRLYTQIIFKDDLSIKQQVDIKNEFNKKIEYFRDKTNLVMVTNFKNTTGAGKSRKRIGFLETFSLIENIL